VVNATEQGHSLATAQGHLAAARHAADGGFFSAAVLQFEQAAQCALTGLLHGVGAPTRARGHDLVALAEAAATAAGLDLSAELGGQLARLARQYAPTRYPDALPGGTPQSRYGQTDAAEAETTVIDVLAAVGAAWTLLLEEAARDDAPDAG
jgi:HEPN domain-containing protein